MKNLKLFIFLCGIATLCAWGCSKKESPCDPPLLKTEWILRSFQNTITNATIDFPSNVEPKEFVVFSDSSNALLVGGTCNGCNGTYSVSGDSIKSKILICSDVLCTALKWETLLTNNMDSIFHYKLNVNKLTLYSLGTYNLNFVAK